MEPVTAEAKMFVYARRQWGMSQRKMARRLGVNQSSISKIESGVHRPRVSTIRKLERLMRQPADHLACLAMGKPLPEPQKPATAAAPAAKEAKVIKLNPRYRRMDSSDLNYLKGKYFVEAHDLERKALRTQYTLREKALKSRLHRLNMEAFREQHQSAADLHAYLQRTDAPADMQQQAKMSLDKAAAQLQKQRFYGINILTSTELARKQLDAECMIIRAALRRKEILQIESVLNTRTKPATITGGRVVSLPAVQDKKYRQV
jgi:transcriptional regulator with XRE-family HTH domain